MAKKVRKFNNNKKHHSLCLTPLPPGPTYFFCKLILPEYTARYAGLLLAPAEGFGWGFFCTSGKKNLSVCHCVKFFFKPVIGPQVTWSVPGLFLVLPHPPPCPQQKKILPTPHFFWQQQIWKCEQISKIIFLF